MTVLLNVFAEWFRSFGYTIAQAEPGDQSGPLLVERDARRLAVFSWLQRDPVAPAYLDQCTQFLKDARIDNGILLCLGPVGDALRAQLQPHGVTVWDTQRIIQELGEAVLSETLPDVWTRTDPLLAPRASRLLSATQPAAAAAPTAPTGPPEPATEPAFPVAATPVLAAPTEQSPTQLELPLAFGILDQPPTNPPLFTVNTKPAEEAAPLPPAATVAPVPAARPGRPILRSHVSKSLALSMVKRKLRTIDRVFLRLSPYHVYDYEATLLIDGSLDAEAKKGRMAVDAAQKKVLEWNLPLETGELAIEGVDVDEKKVRVADVDAQTVLKQELVKLVTRDVVMQEDDDEWSVVVKKKVNLGPNDVRLTPRGLYWIPIWRISGPDGSIEIDASTGNVVFEELLTQRSDTQLI